jgi:quinol-cytochrome oxidoreductase complex cytochrome b subunit
MTLFEKVVLDLNARTIPRGKSTWFYYSGGFVLFLLMVQVVTGVLLMMYYIPTPDAANASVRTIVESVPYGREIRSMHIWSSHGLILFGILHLVGLFINRAYTKPRASMWTTWVALIVLLLGAGFTGYLLPWDQVSYSASKIGTDLLDYIPLVGDWLAGLLRGGEHVAQSTLSRFFGLHVALLPLLIVLLAMSHTALALMFGRPKVAGAAQEPLWPSHMLKENMIWIGLLMILMLASWFLPFGLGQGYDLTAPSDPPSGVHPEWYFLSLYQLLSFVPERLAMLFTICVIVFLFAIPALDPRDELPRKRWITLIAGLILVLYAGLTIMAYFSMDSSEEKSSSVILREPLPRYHHYYT